MINWLNEISAVRRMPRLWVEQLWLLESREPLCVRRSVQFRPGVNVVWAREPESDSGTGLARAGHGVGKTSLCLLLRYVLGDEATAISVLRDKAAANFPKGGVAAKIHIDEMVWLVYRPYGLHSTSVAKQCTQLEALWHEGGGNDFAAYQASLQQSFMSKLAMRTLPGTGQALEWRHLLAWCIREQRTRFDGFFHWREGDGLGFRRPRQDPPLLVNSVLALVDQKNFALMQDIENTQTKLERLEKSIQELEQQPAFEFEHLDRQLRKKVHVADDVPFYSSDMFSVSLESKIAEIQETLEEKIKKNKDATLEAEGELVLMIGELERLKKDWLHCDQDRLIKQALADNNQVEYERLMKESERLQRLDGLCKDGWVNFSDCQYIQKRKATHDLQWVMDVNAVKANRPMRQAELTIAANNAQQAKNTLGQQEKRVSDQQKIIRQMGIRIATDQLEFEQTKQAWSDLMNRLRLREAGEDSPALVQAKKDGLRLKGELDRKRTQLVQHQLRKSQRKDAIQKLTWRLAERLLGEQGYGRFSPDSDIQPFDLSQGGEAYQVLEVLLGDVTCLLDGATSIESQHPGFVVHDCPREADMSSILYANFLQAVQEAEVQLGDGDDVPFQYIVTTTSAPPPGLSQAPCMVLELQSGNEDRLLFKQQLNRGLP